MKLAEWRSFDEDGAAGGVPLALYQWGQGFVGILTFEDLLARRLGQSAPDLLFERLFVGAGWRCWAWGGGWLELGEQGQLVLDYCGSAGYKIPLCSEKRLLSYFSVASDAEGSCCLQRTRFLLRRVASASFHSSHRRW